MEQPSSSEIDPRRACIITFRRLLKHWREANLSNEVSIAVALAGAKAKFRLTADQQRDVDEFLKVKVSEPKKKEPEPPAWSNADFDVS